MIKFKAVKEKEVKHSQRYKEIEEVEGSTACKIVYIRKIALIKAFGKLPEELLITIQETKDHQLVKEGEKVC